jgi:dTDP-glucose 4,6-dehydratase
VHNIGGDNEWENVDIVKTISKLVEQEFIKNSDLAVRFPEAKVAMVQNAESLITHVKDRLSHDRRYAIDAIKPTMS